MKSLKYVAIAISVSLLIITFSFTVIAKEIQFEGNFGDASTGNGSLQNPISIAVDSNNHFYIADLGKRDVRVFDNKGNFQFSFNSKNRGKGKLEAPYSITVDGNDNLYVIDQGSGFEIETTIDSDGNQNTTVNSGKTYIKVFDQQGNFQFSFGSYGKDKGQFRSPTGITTDSQNNLYVTDSARNNVQQLDSQGNFQSQFGSEGKGKGQFQNVTEIATDTRDNLYVVDRWGDVEVFDNQGTFQFQIPIPLSEEAFFSPTGIAIDSDNKVYVTSFAGEDLLRVFDNQGNFQFSFSYQNFGNPPLLSIGGITTGRSGNLYLTDYFQGDVKIFKRQPSSETKNCSLELEDGSEVNMDALCNYADPAH